jgi:hypothetical protein
MGLKIQAPFQTSIQNSTESTLEDKDLPLIQQDIIHQKENQNESNEPEEIIIGIKESDKDELGDPNVGFTPADSFIDKPFEDFNYDMTELGLEISLYFSTLGCFLIWKNRDFIPFEKVKFNEKFLEFSMDEETPPVRILTTPTQIQEIMKLMKQHEEYFLSE